MEPRDDTLLRMRSAGVRMEIIAVEGSQLHFPQSHTLKSASQTLVYRNAGSYQWKLHDTRRLHFFIHNPSPFRSPGTNIGVFCKGGLSFDPMASIPKLQRGRQFESRPEANPQPSLSYANWASQPAPSDVPAEPCPGYAAGVVSCARKVSLAAWSPASRLLDLLELVDWSLSSSGKTLLFMCPIASSIVTPWKNRLLPGKMPPPSATI